MNDKIKDSYFEFSKNTLLLKKYYLKELLGKGFEGEVYRVVEKNTKIERAAKFFYPKRGLNKNNICWYAKKLHKLRTANVIVQYLTQETMILDGEEITFLISEYISGEILQNLINAKKSKKLSELESFLLLHALAKGISEIHALKEYHGDLHPQNIIVCKKGINFELKFLDMFPRGRASKENIFIDLFDIIKIFYDSLGGKDNYKNISPQAKYVCSGLKHGIINKKFKSAFQLKEHIERLEL